MLGYFLLRINDAEWRRMVSWVKPTKLEINKQRSVKI